MEKIEWDQNLSIGIRLIDEQHKALIKRLNDVSVAIEANIGERENSKTLEFLADYADYHFSAEEKQMAEQRYPGLEAQKMKHREFLDTLSNLDQDFEEEGSTRALSDAINNFLFNWLTNHIQGLDKQFGNFLSEKGIAIQEEE
jgi:hemerythrin-like metal-binding protein